MLPYDHNSALCFRLAAEGLWPLSCGNTQISCQHIEAATNFVPVFAMTSNSGGEITLPISENRWRELETPSFPFSSPWG